MERWIFRFMQGMLSFKPRIIKAVYSKAITLPVVVFITVNGKTPTISRGIDIDATFHNDKRFQETRTEIDQSQYMMLERELTSDLHGIRSLH